MGHSEFTDNDKNNISSWMVNNGISTSCNVCNSGEYQLREGIITPQYMDFEAGLLSDDGLPMIAFECDKCAHLRLFALYKILPYMVG